MADTAQIKVTADTSQAERALGSLNNTLKSLATAATISALAKFSDSITNVQNKLSQVTASGQTTNELFNLMAKTSLALGSTLSDTTELFYKMSINTRDLNLTQAETLRTTELLIKGFQLTGMSMAEAQSATTQLGQAFGQGVLRGDELNTVIERLPLVADALSAKFNVQRGALKVLGEQGLITSKDLNDAINASGRVIDEAWGKRIPTIAQSFNRLQTVIEVVTQRFDEQTGVSQVFSYALLVVADAVISVSEWFQKWGKAIFYVVEIIALFIVPARVATAVILNFGKILEWVMAPAIALGEAIAATGNTIATFFGGGVFANIGIGIYNAFSGLRELFGADTKTLADKYADRLDSINKKLGLDAVEASKLREEAEKRRSAQQVSDEKKWKDANQSRLESFRDLIRAQADSIELSQFQSDELVVQNELQKANNALVRAVKNDKGEIIGYTKGLSDVETNILTTLVQQNELYKQQAALKALRAPESTSQVTSRASSMFGQTNQGLEVEAQRQQAALDVLKQNGLISDQAYADQEILINKAKTDAILANEQKAAEARMQITGVTNQGIIDAVKQQMANVAMIQQGGVQGAQGVLGALDTVYGSMAQHSRKAFETHKALATAQAIISTYQAAAAALAFPPGPPISLAYVAAAVAAGMAQVATIQSQTYSGKALGGSVSGNTPYIVGEKGPEMFVPAGSGTIVPNSELRGNKNVNINFNIQANDASGFDSLLMERRGMITQFVRDAMAEQGQRSSI